MQPRKSMFVSRTASGTTATSTTPGKPPAPSKPQVAPLMTVAVRVRPLSAREYAVGHRPVVMVESDTAASIAKLERMGAVLQSEKGQMHTYEFDRVFSETTSNREVYESTAKKLVPKVLDGMNCTIFAYGATGAGKTHSIMGNESDPGMMPLSMMDLFDAINNSDEPHTFVVKVSYMEVYCETIRDLLSDSEKPLNPCEHPTDGTVRVLGLTEREVHDVYEVLDLVREGSGRRKTEPTAANEFSSRSHAVLQVTVQKILPVPAHQMPVTIARTSLLATSRRNSISGKVMTVAAPEPIIRQARLSLIDLAGSERAAATLNTGTRLREGANINKSLLALANCINALSTGSERVKYRDSKLTHLLKSSLEGDCFVAMLAAVNPSHKSYEESHNTLKYAHRAKNIKANVPVPAASLSGTTTTATTATAIPAMMSTTFLPQTTTMTMNHNLTAAVAPPATTPSKAPNTMVIESSSMYSSRSRNSLPSPPPAAPPAPPPAIVEIMHQPRQPIISSQPPPAAIVSHHQALAPVDENVPTPSSSKKSVPFFSLVGSSPPHANQPVVATVVGSAMKREKPSNDLPRLEQAFLAVKQERDRIAEERDELRVELQRARETIASLKRSSISFPVSSSQNMSSAANGVAPAIPPKPRASSAHLLQQKTSSFGLQQQQQPQYGGHHHPVTRPSSMHAGSVRIGTGK